MIHDDLRRTWFCSIFSILSPKDTRALEIAQNGWALGAHSIIHSAGEINTVIAKTKKNIYRRINIWHVHTKQNGMEKSVLNGELKKFIRNPQLNVFSFYVYDVRWSPWKEKEQIGAEREKCTTNREKENIFGAFVIDERKWWKLITWRMLKRPFHPRISVRLYLFYFFLAQLLSMYVMRLFASCYVVPTQPKT